jgi:hypothetical protein
MSDPLIAKKRIEDAQNSKANVAKKRLEEADANRQSYEKFYNQLSLLSGGSIALSVTYLGYLKTVTTHPQQLKLLVASWVVMFLCLVSATFYSFFNTSYVHYARSREYAEAVKEVHETVADEVPNVRVVGVETKEQQDAYIKELRDAAAAREKDVMWNRRKERRHEILFGACGITARVSMVLGIALLLSFAVANVTVRQTAAEGKSSDTTQEHSTPVNNPAASKDKVVHIPCVGIVTFPASISDADVNAACKALFDKAEETRKKNGMPPCKIP